VHGRSPPCISWIQILSEVAVLPVRGLRGPPGRRLAAQAHDGQDRRKLGRYVVTHPLRVAHIIDELKLAVASGCARPACTTVWGGGGWTPPRRSISSAISSAMEIGSWSRSPQARKAAVLDARGAAGREFRKIVLRDGGDYRRHRSRCCLGPSLPRESGSTTAPLHHLPSREAGADRLRDMRSMRRWQPARYTVGQGSTIRGLSFKNLNPASRAARRRVRQVAQREARRHPSPSRADRQGDDR